MSEEVRIIATDNSLVRSNHNSGWRIIYMRQLVKRNVTRPLAVIGGAVVGQTAIAGFSDWYDASRVIADVPASIRIDHVLHRRRISAQSLRKLVPIVRSIQGVNAARVVELRIQRAPAQGITLTVPFQHDRPMSGDSYVDGH